MGDRKPRRADTPASSLGMKLQHISRALAGSAVSALLLMSCSAAPASDADKSVYFADAITAWAGESWYPQVKNVWVVGPTGFVQVDPPDNADTICRALALAVYGRDAKPIGIKGLQVVDANKVRLTSCAAQ